MNEIVKSIWVVAGHHQIVLWLDFASNFAKCEENRKVCLGGGKAPSNYSMARQNLKNFAKCEIFYQVYLVVAGHHEIILWLDFVKYFAKCEENCKVYLVVAGHHEIILWLDRI